MPRVHVRARTFESFGYEWTTFGDIHEEDEAFWRTYVKDVPLAELLGKLALDVGCGKGRYAVFTARHVGHLIALDGSRAVEAASRNLSDENASVVRADLLDLPFGDEYFDFVQCLGVLHHLESPVSGFESVSRVVRPGGLLLLYLYSRDVGSSLRNRGLAVSAALRRVTVRLPHPVLRRLCLPLAAALYVALVLPGRRFAGLPLATYRGKPLRSLWLDTFDRLSAPVEHRYIWPDVEGWFAEYEVLSVRDEAGLFITARKVAA